jgi:hypothetical protein
MRGVSYGDGGMASRVYERLRKRSYRRWAWPSPLHRAYVRGVREALDALRKEQSVD